MANPFPYPTENITSLSGLLQHANSLVNGLFGTFILVALFIISLISTKRYSTENSLAYASFFTFIASIFLRFMQLINDVTFFTCIGIMVISAIYLWAKD